MKITIDINPEDEQLSESLIMQTTDNFNFVSINVRGTWYDVAVDDLYRATLPFMDARNEGRSEN